MRRNTRKPGCSLHWPLAAALLALGLAGCVVIHRAKYPLAWSPIHTSTNSQCVDVAGSFENTGLVKRETGMQTIALTTLLFPAADRVEGASSVDLRLWGGNSVDVIATFADGATLEHLLRDDGECTPRERSFKDPSDPTGMNHEHIAGVLGTTLTFFRADDGSLIVRTTNRDLTVAELVPNATDVRYWYRFSPRVPASP